MLVIKNPPHVKQVWEKSHRVGLCDSSAFLRTFCVLNLNLITEINVFMHIY